jgi:hypothetical protein
MLRWIADCESWGSTLCRALEETLRQAAVTEAEIVQFNDLVGQDPVAFEHDLGGLMRGFAVPVGQSFSIATLAACSVELVRRWTRGPSM